LIVQKYFFIIHIHSKKYCPKGLQLRKQGSNKFGPLALNDDLETYLESHPYVSGFSPTQKDAEMYTQFATDHTPPKTPNVLRWFEHVASFPESVRNKW